MRLIFAADINAAMKKYALFTLLLTITIAATANVRLPSVVGNNMVLQQQSQVKLWGWADPAEKVFITTSWNGKTDSTITTRDAKWQLLVATPAAGGPFTVTIKGRNTITLTNVLVGEVWVCSGQSNMEMSGNWGLKDIKAELPTAYNADIRFFQIPRATAEHPQDDCTAQWTVCDSTTLKAFSAAGYFFGKRLNTAMHVPIGLIEASWGGTPAEVWTPDSVVNSDAVLKEAAAKQVPYEGWPYMPGYTYNAMIAPVVPYSIAGAIWYQGEANVGTAGAYRQLFTSMISAWRKAWNKDFPFYYVQIAPFKYGSPYVAALLREAQLQSMQLNNTGMAVITDITGDTSDIHPTNKHDVGKRLANWALAKTYSQQDISFTGPLYKSMSIKNNRIIINFYNPEEGIVTKGKRQVTELYIAGRDKIFHKANADIKGNTLVVWSSDIKKPEAVRYAFGNTAIGNLFGLNGLPASPFRTDNWEVDTK